MRQRTGDHQLNRVGLGVALPVGEQVVLQEHFPQSHALQRGSEGIG